MVRPGSPHKNIVRDSLENYTLLRHPQAQEPYVKEDKFLRILVSWVGQKVNPALYDEKFLMKIMTVSVHCK
jgi:hypothetical protein